MNTVDPSLQPVTLGGLEVIHYFTRFFGNQIRCARAISRRHGNFVFLRNPVALAGLPRSVVFAADASLYREILGQPHIWRTVNIATATPKNHAARRLTKGIVSMQGKRHEHYRRLLIPPLRRASVMERSAEMGRVADRATDRWPVDQFVDLFALVRRLMQDFATTLLFGDDQESWYRTMVEAPARPPQPRVRRSSRKRSREQRPSRSPRDVAVVRPRRGRDGEHVVMDLTQLANLGEFIGGVAVLVTLIYLALQVRQNTRQSAGTLQYTMLAEHNRLLEATRASGEHAAIAVKASRGDALDPVEEIQFQADVELALNNWFGVQQAFDLGLIEDQFFQIFCDDVTRTLDVIPALRHRARSILGSYEKIDRARIYAPIFEKEPRE